MTQAGKQNSYPGPNTQLRTHRYLLSEDADFELRDVARGLTALSQIIDQHESTELEIDNEDWGSLFRVFGCRVRDICEAASFAYPATGKQELH